MSLRLTITKGPALGKTMEFPPGRTVRIGRVVRGNNFTIPDSGVSQKHLTIQGSDLGQWHLRDLASSNGTFLNGSPLDPSSPAALLRDGDLVVIGESTSISVAISADAEVRVRRRGRPRKNEENEKELLPRVARPRTRRGKNACEVVDEVGGDGVAERACGSGEKDGIVERPGSKDGDVETALGLGEKSGILENPGSKDGNVERACGLGLGEVEKEVDLEKMTLGEWFSWIEVDLPRQIIEASEEKIREMGLKSQRVREYVEQQKMKGGGK